MVCNCSYGESVLIFICSLSPWAYTLDNLTSPPVKSCTNNCYSDHPERVDIIKYLCSLCLIHFVGVSLASVRWDSCVYFSSDDPLPVITSRVEKLESAGAAFDLTHRDSFKSAVIGGSAM